MPANTIRKAIVARPLIMVYHLFAQPTQRGREVLADGCDIPSDSDQHINSRHRCGESHWVTSRCVLYCLGCAQTCSTGCPGLYSSFFGGSQPSSRVMSRLGLPIS